MKTSVSNSLMCGPFDFFRGSYAADHPASNRATITDSNCIALLTCMGHTFSVRLNTEDARGYGTITRLLAQPQERMDTTFNRSYSLVERSAYHRVQALVENAYEKLGLVPQHLALCNEALSKSAHGNRVQIGTRNEPMTLGCMTIGRGISEHCYVKDAPLLMPSFGMIFDEQGLGGTKGQEHKYQTKVSWSAPELGDNAKLNVVQSLRAALCQVVESASRAFEVTASMEDKSLPIPQPDAFSYYEGKYGNEHWCLDSRELSASDVVGIIGCHGSRFSVYPIPVDCRGYRTVVRLMPPVPGMDITTTYNRDFSLDERIAFHDALGVIEQMYLQMGLFPQQHILANMAHRFDRESNSMRLGHEGEPLMLHAHTVGRGIPNLEYVPDMPLIAPPLGRAFDIGGKGGWNEQSDGNGAIPWNKVSQHFSGQDGIEWHKSMIRTMKVALGGLVEPYRALGFSIDV